MEAWAVGTGYGRAVSLSHDQARDGGDESPLLRKARAGDEAAFAELVERYKRRAYYAALALVGSHDDALDLSQDAFVRAFAARTSIDPARPFYGWLYTIIRRLCFNFLRDRKRRSEKLREAASWLRLRSEEPAPDIGLERAEAVSRVTAALDELTEVEREVLTLKEWQGLKYREIAELLEVPIGTVMSRLYAARRRLAQALEVQQ